MRIRTIALCLLAMTAGSSSRAAPLALPEGAKAALTSFIRAFAAHDSDSLRRLSPSTAARAIGPCPFASHPRLGRTVVDGEWATVELICTAPGGRQQRGVCLLHRVGAALPPLPALADRLRPIADAAGWRVRYVLQDNEGAVLKRARSGGTPEQQMAVRLITTIYLQAWRRQPAPDYGTISALRCDPWVFANSFTKASVGGIEMKDVTRLPEGWGVSFGVTAKKFGLPITRVSGRCVLLQENGDWRVRVESLDM